MTLRSWFARIFPAPTASAPNSPPAPRPSVPTVRFDASRVTGEVRSDALSNLREIREFRGLGDNSFNELYRAALKSMEKGRDLGSLTSAILELNIDGVTKARAGQIATSLHNKASAIMTKNRQDDLGIKYAIWLHAAPCYRSKKPTKADLARDAAHREADGKRYEVAKGMLIRSRRTWPGRDAGCRCIERSVIPGLSRDAT